MDLSRNQSAVLSGGLHSSQKKPQQTQNMLASKLFFMFNTTCRWL